MADTDATETRQAAPAPAPAPAAPPVLNELFGALAIAQGTFEVPKKTKTAKVRGKNRDGGVVEYSYKYSTLDDLIEATRSSLSASGLAVFQDVEVVGTKVTVWTIIGHASGQVWKSRPLTLIADGDSPQKIGSAETYARRYSMSAALGVASEDDDDAAEASERARNGSGNRREVQRPDETDQRTDEQRARDRGKTKDAKADEPADSKPGILDNELPPEKTKSDEPAKKVGKGDLAHYPGCINAKQVKRLFSIAEQHNVSMNDLRAFLADGGISSSDRIPVANYDGIVAAIQNGHVTPQK